MLAVGKVSGVDIESAVDIVGTNFDHAEWSAYPREVVAAAGAPHAVARVSGEQRACGVSFTREGRVLYNP